MNSHYIRVVTKPCNMKLVIGITLISVNQNSRTALVRSVIKYEVCVSVDIGTVALTDT